MRGVVLALLCAAGCLAAPDAGEAPPDGATGCPSVGHLHDDFDGDQPDLWQEFGGPGGCTLRVDGGRLEVDTTGSCGLATAGCYDLSDRWVQVDAVTPGTGLEFAVHLDDFGDDLVIAIDGNEALVVRHVDPDGVVTALTSLPFDRDRHQLWRIWHSATENRITFETSPRAAPSWSRLAELWLDGVSVRRTAVRLGASETGGIVAFDSLAGVDL